MTPKVLEALLFFNSMYLEPLKEGEINWWTKDTVIIFLIWGLGHKGLLGSWMEPNVFIGLRAGCEAPQKGLSGIAAKVPHYSWASGTPQHLTIKDLVTSARGRLELVGSCSWVSLEHVGLNQGGKAASQRVVTGIPIGQLLFFLQYSDLGDWWHAGVPEAGQLEGFLNTGIENEAWLISNVCPTHCTFLR